MIKRLNIRIKSLNGKKKFIICANTPVIIIPNNEISSYLLKDLSKGMLYTDFIDKFLIQSQSSYASYNKFEYPKYKTIKVKPFVWGYKKPQYKNLNRKNYSYFDAFTIFPKKNSSIINDLKSLEPFGKDNPEPIFYFKNIKSIKSKIINKRHVQNILKNKSGRSIKSISFDCVNSELGKYLLNFKKEFDLIGSIVENNWNNKKDLELRVIDIIQKT